MRSSLPWVLTGMLALASHPAAAQERAYFVTYDHYLEEPGDLELSVATTTGVPKNGHSAYTAPWLELEYGITEWWTAELYLEGVTTIRDGSGFTGWRWENRFRPFESEHRVNPVLYVEYESINEASRIQKEIVGTGALSFAPIADLRQTVAHELEGKLILSSVVGPWNLADNFTVEKNLSASEGLEYGYSIGVSRALSTLASGTSCRFCAENFVVGAEAYGGLGTSLERSLSDTRHFIAPILGWYLSPNTTLRLSAAFGLTGASDRYLFRVGYSYELQTRRRH
jgi:hypothetical protein